jgi:hypothetical protein
MGRSGGSFPRSPASEDSIGCLGRPRPARIEGRRGPTQARRSMGSATATPEGLDPLCRPAWAAPRRRLSAQRHMVQFAQLIGSIAFAAKRFIATCA